MPRERLPMRKISDVLRLHAGGLSKRRIAVSLNIGRTAVGDYINRARRAGLGWPLAEDLSDEDLERLLFPPPVAVSPDRRSLPDWPVLHRELKRPGVTLSLLWEGALLLEHLPHRLALDRRMRPLLGVLDAPIHQPRVDLGVRAAPRAGHEQAAADVTHLPLDLPLLPARTRSARHRLHQMVGAQLQEAPVVGALLAHEHRAHRRLHVVVDVPRRQTPPKKRKARSCASNTISWLSRGKI